MNTVKVLVEDSGPRTRGARTAQYGVVPRKGDLLPSPFVEDERVEVVAVVLAPVRGDDELVATVHVKDVTQGDEGAIRHRNVSEAERLILTHLIQLRLELRDLAASKKTSTKLSPSSSAPSALTLKGDLEDALQVAQSGYEGFYEILFNAISTPVSARVSSFVIEVLGMYWALAECTDEALQKHANRYWLEFPGFDGNEEFHELNVAEFIIDVQGRFDGLKAKNSHMPTLRVYKNMLSVWRELPDKYRMSTESALKVLDAVRQP